MLKKITSVILATMIITMSTTVMADSADITTPSAPSKMAVENPTVIPESAMVFDLPNPNDTAPVTDNQNLESSAAIPIPPEVLNNLDLQNLPAEQQLPAANTLSLNYSEFTFEGNIATEGDIYAIGPIVLHPRQICQAQMTRSFYATLEYDLFIYEYDTVANNLISPPVAASAYTGNDLPDAVGKVNEFSPAKTYYVIVTARNGASAEQIDKFTVKLTLDSQYDPYEYESNENAFSPTLPVHWTDQAETLYRIDNASLNTPIDTDWYEIPVASSEYAALVIDMTIGSFTNVVMDLYKATSNSTLTKMPSYIRDKEFVANISSNTTYYLKVSSNKKVAFSAPRYDFIISWAKHPAKVSVEILVENEPIFISTDWFDRLPRYLLMYGKEMKLVVKYYTEDDRLLEKIVDEIGIQFTNTKWNVGTSNHTIYGKGEADNGIAVATIKIGQLYSAMTYEQVQVKLFSANYGYFFDGNMMLVTRYQ